MRDIRAILRNAGVGAVAVLATLGASAGSARAAASGAAAPSPRVNAGKANAAAPAREPAPRRELPFYFDVFGFGGYSQPDLQGIWWNPVSSYQTSVALVQGGIGGTAAYRLGSPSLFGNPVAICVGLTADYRFFAQQSAIDVQVGSFNATRLNPASPTLILFGWKSIVMKFDFQFLGSYSFVSKNADGESVSFTRPRGARLAAMYSLGQMTPLENSWLDKIFVGLEAEALSFSVIETGGGSSTEVATSLSVLQAGLVAAYVF